MFEYRVRTTASGRPQFLRSYSFSHHDNHHHHRHHRTRCFDNCAGIALEDWNSLCEQNKDFIARNETLTRENQTLKGDLRTSNQERDRLFTYSQQLKDEIDGLRRSYSHDGDRAARFSRRVADLSTEVEKKDRDIRRLEKNNTILDKRVHVLSDTVSEKNQEISDLASELLGWQRRYEKARRMLEIRTRELDERNLFVDEQHRMICHLKSTLPSRPRYNYA
ncbi:hypothetical protein F4677DRAFT_268700 [Hypoxylon crocopeplum]|nr:hypothetical protein F4677DRAFT_268700 [Hypoxylon crocopeplum]